MAQLKTLQTERKESDREAMQQAKLLYELAQAEGKPYRPKAFFVTAPEVRESVFSSTEVARELSRDALLDAAETTATPNACPKKTNPKSPSRPPPDRAAGCRLRKGGVCFGNPQNG